MTTKKVVVIVGLVVAAAALLITLFVGGIVGLVFYGIGNSEAAETAKTFLRANPRLRQEIGEVRDFGFFVTGNINAHGGTGTAALGLKAKGERKDLDTTVELAYRAGREWRVVEAYFHDDSGERVYLTQNFEGGGAPGAAGAGGFDEESFEANVLRSERPVLVVVGSPSSLDSVELDRTLDMIAPKYEGSVGLVRFNLSEQPAVLERLSVEGVPTVMLFKRGVEEERLSGKISRQELTALINEHLE